MERHHRAAAQRRDDSAQQAALMATLSLGDTMPMVWLTNAMAADLPKAQWREPDAQCGAWLQ